MTHIVSQIREVHLHPIANQVAVQAANQLVTLLAAVKPSLFYLVQTHAAISYSARLIHDDLMRIVPPQPLSLLFAVSLTRVYFLISPTFLSHRYLSLVDNSASFLGLRRQLVKALLAY